VARAPSPARGRKDRRWFSQFLVGRRDFEQEITAHANHVAFELD